MNKESNAYIILFSVIMVVVMGVSLAIVAQLTKEPYEANVKKRKNAEHLNVCEYYSRQRFCS